MTCETPEPGEPESSEIISHFDKTFMKNAIEEAEKSKPSQALKDNYSRALLTSEVETNRLVPIGHLLKDHKAWDEPIIGFKVLDWTDIEMVELFEPGPRSCGFGRGNGRPYPLCTKNQRFEGYLATRCEGGYEHNNFAVQIISEKRKTCAVEVEVLHKWKHRGPGFFSFTQSHKHPFPGRKELQAYSVKFNNGVEQEGTLCTMYTSSGEAFIGRPNIVMYTYEDLTLAPLVPSEKFKQEWQRIANID